MASVILSVLVPLLLSAAGAVWLGGRGEFSLAAALLAVGAVVGVLAGAWSFRRKILLPLGRIVNAEPAATEAPPDSRRLERGLLPSFDAVAQRLQAGLLASQARLQTIFEATPTPICINRLRDFAYIEVNPAWIRLYGPSNCAVRNQTLKSLGFTVVNLEALREQTRRLLATGAVDNEEAEFICPDGHRVSIIYSSRVIELGGEKVMISMNTDVTRLKEVEAGLRQTQDALRHSEAKFVALFQSSPLAMSVFVREGGAYVISEVNEAWSRAFGHAPTEVAGRPAADFGFSAGEAETDLQVLEQDDFVHEYDMTLRRPDGPAQVFAVSGRRILVGDRPLLLAAYADVTEKRRAEREIRALNSTLESRIQERTRELQVAQGELMRSEKLASLGALVPGVAHDVNTPIGNSLAVATTLVDHTVEMRRAMAGALRRTQLEEYVAEVESGAAILTRSLERAAELIQSLKAIAVDQASDQRREFDLRQVLEDTLVALRPSLKKKPYVIRADIADNLGMDSFPGPLEQVVVNLINNAVMHGFDGREHGEVVIEGYAVDDAWVRLRVCDDGCGIPADNLSHIFDPFFTTKLGKGGSGLGLHIVRSIVEEILGGRIGAESKPGCGTSISINMPRRAPVAQAPLPAIQ